jgi:hypothetical protein
VEEEEEGLLTDIGGVATGALRELRIMVCVVVGIYVGGKRALVFPACVYEHQFPVTEKMVIPSVVYDQRVLPIIINTPSIRKKRRTIAQRRLPRRDDGNIRWALGTAPRTDILKVRVKISFRQPRLGKPHRLGIVSRMSAKQSHHHHHHHHRSRYSPHHTHTHTQYRKRNTPPARTPE